jgi:hypothetical protein
VRARLSLVIHRHMGGRLVKKLPLSLREQVEQTLT